MGLQEKFEAYFREIHPKFTRFYTGILEDVDLTLPQYALLNQLSSLGSISMTGASARLQITKPAVTNLVDRLEGKKLITRSPHPKDRRVILLRILPKGQKIVNQIQASSLKMFLKAYRQFNESERTAIDQFYAALSKTMDDFLLRSKNEL